MAAPLVFRGTVFKRVIECVENTLESLKEFNLKTVEPKTIPGSKWKGELNQASIIKLFRY